MAASNNNNKLPQSYFSQTSYLSPQQQNLLLAAFNSQGKRAPNGPLDTLNTPQKPIQTDNSTGASPSNGLNGESNTGHGSSMSPFEQTSENSQNVNPSMLNSHALKQNADEVNSPDSQFANSSGVFGENMWAAFDANGGLNFDTVTEDVTFNFDQNGIEGSPEEDRGREKRKSHDSDDEEGDDDDDDEEQTPSKNANGRVSKKPGRKPLTSEPTTKRKAQNRAAQRAFRERKEKHLRDLELKVEDLEKTSATANEENGLLKARIARLQSEVEDYRKRLSVVNSALNGSSSSTDNYSSFQQRHSSDFNFEFPRFGSPKDLNGSPSANTNGSGTQKHSPGSTFTQDNRTSSASRSSFSPSGTNAESPASVNGASVPRQGIHDKSSRRNTGASADANFNNASSPTGLWQTTSSTSGLTEAGLSAAQQLSPFGMSGYATSIVDSPPNLMTPQNGSASSCGTSPEPSAFTNNNNSYSSEDASNNSAANRVNGQPGALPYPISSHHGSDIDFSNFDWLTNQNASFDPLLFGDYRESQDAIVGVGDFTGGLYDESNNDGFPTFAEIQSGQFTATNKQQQQQQPRPNSSAMTPNSNQQRSFPNTPAKSANLMEQVERQKEGSYNEQSANTVTPKASSPCTLTSNANGVQVMSAKAIFSHLKANPRFQNGDFDIDTLCSELSAKATCSETGMSIPTQEVHKVLWKMANADASISPAVASTIPPHQNQSPK